MCGDLSALKYQRSEFSIDSIFQIFHWLFSPPPILGSISMFKTFMHGDLSALVKSAKIGSHIYSTIHKAGSLTVHGCSTGLSGIIPVEQKSVHWLSMGAAGRNDPQRPFCTVAGCTAAL